MLSVSIWKSGKRVQLLSNIVISCKPASHLPSNFLVIRAWRSAAISREPRGASDSVDMVQYRWLYQKGALAGDINAPRSARVGRAHQSRLGRVEAGQTRAERRRGTARGAGGKEGGRGANQASEPGFRRGKRNQESYSGSTVHQRVRDPHSLGSQFGKQKGMSKPEHVQSSISNFSTDEQATR